jgi:hypothetical protein
MEWQPIESAPRDETWLLLYWGDEQPWQVEANGMALGFWSIEGADWFDSEAASNPLLAPTHWMPLPAPPPQPMSDT